MGIEIGRIIQFWHKTCISMFSK